MPSLTNKVEPRIWKGDQGSLSEHKWLVSISIMPPVEFVCAGTLVAPTWVLSLGTCTRFKNVSYWVRAGSDRIHQDGISMHVESIHRLSQYKVLDSKDAIQDLALLKLENELEGRFIEAVKLPDELEFLSLGAEVNVSGWGRPGDTIETPPSELPFRTISMKVVKSGEFMIFPLVWIQLFNTTSVNVLLYGAYGNGACFRDVGSPVVRNGVLYGIILPGHICGLNRLYTSVMTKITTYVKWIKRFINDDVAIESNTTRRNTN